MQTSELIIATPYYVLMDQKTPFGPTVSDPILNVEYTAIFGFSDKAPYDSFCRECSLPLTPYPLVKGYLRNQLGTSGHDDASERCVKLVILDASGPRAPNVHAATMLAVLEAQEKGTAHVTSTQNLTFHPETHAYHFEETHGYFASLDCLSRE